MSKPARRDLELTRPDDPDAAVQRELARIKGRRAQQDDPVIAARRAALAEQLERAHKAWATNGGKKS